MASKHLMPMDEAELDEALKETKNFIDSHKNSSS